MSGAGEPSDSKAEDKVAPASTGGTVSGQGQGDPAPVVTEKAEPSAPEPTEDRPARKPRKASTKDTKGATETAKPKRARKPKGGGA